VTGKRFVSVGECMIEMSGGAGNLYRLGYAGDTLNTAWYARALLPPDWQVDYVTALGDDRYSAEMRAFLERHGIGTGHIRTVPGRRPGLYLIHQEAGDRHFTYWRGQSAAKLLADDPAALSDAFADAGLIYFSGITLAILDPRARGRLMHAIVAARDNGARIAFDTNVRPALWTSPRVMASALTAAASIADIVLPTHSDEAPLFGDTHPEATALRYRDLGAQEVAVKNGAAAGHLAAGEIANALGPEGSPQVVDTTGAGDSFNGAYLAARLTGQEPLDAARLAHRIAGVVIGHPGALVDPALVRPAAW
jgi:2-dehydro-3-deoxygluconokinase